MSCDRYTAALADHALGADLAPDAAAHLRTCAACAARLADERRAIDGLDGELQQLLTIEPSAHFAARVQANVAAAPAPRRNMLFAWSGFAAAAAVALALFLVADRDPRGGRAIDPAPTPTTTAPGVVKGPAPVPQPTIARKEAPGADTAIGRIEPRPRPARRTATAAPEPEVLVPSGQMQAVDRYIALVRSGRLDTANLVAKTDADPTPAELVLGPLEIGPMTVKEIDDTTANAVERRHEQE